MHDCTWPSAVKFACRIMLYSRHGFACGSCVTLMLSRLLLGTLALLGCSDTSMLQAKVAIQPYAKYLGTHALNSLLDLLPLNDFGMLAGFSICTSCIMFASSQCSSHIGLRCMQVVQAIGASESDVLGLVTGANPRKVEGDGAINIVNAAAALGVTQYVMVTSMGTGKIGFPASECSLLRFSF